MSKLVHKVEAVAAKLAHPKSSTTTTEKPGIVTAGLESTGIAPPKDGQRTPADEAIFFFESSPAAEAQLVQVWDLQLEEDGAPSKDKAVRMGSLRTPSIDSDVAHFTVYPLAPSLCPLRSSRIDRCGLTCNKKWRVQNQLSSRWRRL